MNEPSTSHRWRFSLRALLLLVTALTVYLGWQARTVNQRQSVLKAVEQTGGWTAMPDVAPQTPELARRNPGWLRRQMGDEAVSVIVFFRPDAASEELQSRIRRAFPEATLVIDDEQVLFDPIAVPALRRNGSQTPSAR